MISKDKKYKTKGGCEIIVYEVFDENVHCKLKSPFDDRWVIASIPKDCIEEISPYADFKIDDKVLVWNEGELRKPRYFAGINEEGKPMAFDDGRTSFTTQNKVAWSHCIKYEENND